MAGYLHFRLFPLSHFFQCFNCFIFFCCCWQPFSAGASSGVVLRVWPWILVFTAQSFFPQTVCLTLGVLTVIVKGRVPRSRCRTDFVAIFVLSCLHAHFRRYLRTFRGGALVGPRCFV